MHVCNNYIHVHVLYMNQVVGFTLRLRLVCMGTMVIHDRYVTLLLLAKFVTMNTLQPIILAVFEFRGEAPSQV